MYGFIMIFSRSTGRNSDRPKSSFVRAFRPVFLSDTPGKRPPCLHERTNERKNIFKNEITENLFTFNKTTNEEFTQICYSNGRKVTVQPGLCIHCTDRMKE